LTLFVEQQDYCLLKASNSKPETEASFSFSTHIFNSNRLSALTGLNSVVFNLCKRIKHPLLAKCPPFSALDPPLMLWKWMPVEPPDGLPKPSDGRPRSSNRRDNCVPILRNVAHYSPASRSNPWKRDAIYMFNCRLRILERK
jgi:hypothetical protein